MGSGTRILLVIFTLFIAICPTLGSVCSIDLGSESMKVAVVHLKPGQSPISIAINEMSKRKSPALVAFNGGDRLVAEEAAGISARYPDKVIVQARDMVGKSYDQVKALADSLYLPYDIVEDSRGAAGIRVDNDGRTVYSVEELVSMILSYGRHLAEYHTKVPIKDAVISVPPFFGQAERNGIIQAAQLAGINVLSLINEHSGAAIQYGIDKDFSNASRHVVFYDMGSNSAYAALVYFSAYTTKEYGKSVSVNQFQVKDVRWKANLGGQTMEMRLVEHFADEFNRQVGNGIDVRKSSKAMAKLKKQIKRTKEILSANTEAPLSVESIYEDRDFRSTITRQKFEELCGDLFEEALLPVKEILKHSGLKVEDLYAVELIGGATRMPKLQAMLQEFLGRKDLDKHLDADEAVVLGSALHAANLSDGIKLTRKLGMIDGATYGIILELNSPDLDNEEGNQQVLIQRMKKLPSKAFKSVKYSKDFEVSLLYDPSDILPPGVSSVKIATYHVSGLTDTYTKYATRNLSAPIKTNLHFSLSRSGLVSFDRAETVIEVSEWVDVPVKNLTAENSTLILSNTSSESSTSPTSSSEKEEGNLSGEGFENNTTTPEKETQESKPITEKKLRKRTFRVPLKVTDVTDGPGRSLSKESLAEAGVRLFDLNQKDAERKRTAELKNSLEEYIYSTKEKLDSSEDIEKISTQEQRNSFKDKLDEAQEWLYMDGEDASAAEFQEHLDSLKTIGGEIFFRLKELSARPVAVIYVRKYLDGLHKTLDEWEKNKPWIGQSFKDEILNEADKIKKWLDENEVGKPIKSNGIISRSLFGWGGSIDPKKDSPTYHNIDPPFPPSLLQNTFLAGKEVRCCYRACEDGFSATSFHQHCDFKGPCVIVGYTQKGLRFGGFNPEGYRSTDDYYDTLEAFLFYWPQHCHGNAEEESEDVELLPKVGGSGAALFDYRRGGPQFGPDGLLIGPPMASVMGGFAGPDTNSGVGDLKIAKSRLGLSYAKRSDGKDSVFGDDRTANLVDVHVFCSPQIADLYC